MVSIFVCVALAGLTAGFAVRRAPPADEDWGGDEPVVRARPSTPRVPRPAAVDEGPLDDELFRPPVGGGQYPQFLEPLERSRGAHRTLGRPEGSYLHDPSNGWRKLSGRTFVRVPVEQVPPELRARATPPGGNVDRLPR